MHDHDCFVLPKPVEEAVWPEAVRVSSKGARTNQGIKAATRAVTERKFRLGLLLTRASHASAHLLQPGWLNVMFSRDLHQGVD